MKLMGSIIEEQFRKQLLESKRLILENCIPKLRDALEQAFPDALEPYVLNVVPEQGEEIYTVLVNKIYIVVIEIPRNGTETILRIESADKYQRAIKAKQKKIQFAVAIAL